MSKRVRCSPNWAPISAEPSVRQVRAKPDLDSSEKMSFLCNSLRLCGCLCVSVSVSVSIGKHFLYVSDYQLSGPAALRGGRRPLNAAAAADGTHAGLPVAEREEEEEEEERRERLSPFNSLRSSARGSFLTPPSLPVMFSCLGIIPCMGADKQSRSRGDTCTATSTGW